MSWKYDEKKHCGVDYGSAEEVAVYDTRHQQFRDYAKEVDGFLSELSSDDTRNMTLIDLGCGTGAFSINAAHCFKRIYSVDISKMMLQVAQDKAIKQRIDNITFINAGFLSYHHVPEPADLLLSRFAFHHLPDFWKQEALLNMNRMLKIDGLFFLYDVIFNFEAYESDDAIGGWIQSYASRVQPEFLKEFEIHIREEYSTYSWIMDGLMERAGFFVEKKGTDDNIHMMYRCRKTEDR